LLLLRISFSAPRVQHLLRCSPSVDNPGLETFHSLLRSALTRIANTDILDSLWLQASLPINDGGLGIRQVRSLALPAYLASAASTSDLQSQILSVTSCASPLISTLILTSPLGKQLSIHCQRLIRFLTSSPSGTDLVSRHLGQWSSLPFLTQYKWLHFWLHLPLRVGTGFWHCLFHPAG